MEGSEIREEASETSDAIKSNGTKKIFVAGATGSTGLSIADALLSEPDKFVSLPVFATSRALTSCPHFSMS